MEEYVSATHLPLYTVDSFSSKPFSGNPAGVCLDTTENGLAEDEMQKIAAEMNISETGFVRNVDGGTFENGARFRLRWFTPTREVPLCGHGTLAAAAALHYCRDNKNRTLAFETHSGDITAEVKDDFITLNMPLNTPEPVQDLEAIEPLLKLVTGDHFSSIRDVQFSAKASKLLVRMSDSFTRDDLERLSPPIGQFISTYNPGGTYGVIVTVIAGSSCAHSDTGRRYDFVSRYFAPWNGIPEDPVTGSAHTVLAGYWSKQLGKISMFARQCSRRGGDVAVTLRQEGRVDIAGPATVVLWGRIRIS